MSNLSNGFTEKQIAACISSKRLELTILPTEKCNFRCTYCYEDFLIGRMREAIQESVVKLIERRSSELNQLSLNWFGGEPLLGLSVIRNIGTKSFELAKKHGYQLTGSMTTNGYLLEKQFWETILDTQDSRLLTGFMLSGVKG